MALNAILASIGVSVLVRTVKSVLSKSSNSLAKGAADALDIVDKAIENGNITADEVKEANRHLEAMEQLQSEEFKTLISEVNQSLRTEVASEDKYVRRMRPTFGYIMAITWAAQMLSVAYVILDKPEEAGTIMNGLADLSAIWTVGLSVLGIYVYKRSRDKEIRK